MANQFYNPYHFVPLNNKAPENTESFEDIKQGNTHVTHQLWKKDLLSGSIFVALTNTSPLIVGGERNPRDDGGSNVNFFRQKNGGGSDGSAKLSIPGSTMRGMISNVLESISDAPMRVLEDTSLSVRMPATEQTYSAMGIVRVDDGKYYIEPLTYRSTNKARYNNGQLKFSQWDAEDEECIHKDYLISEGELNWEDYLKWHIPAYKKKFGSLELDTTYLFKGTSPIPSFHGKTENYVYVYEAFSNPTAEEDDLSVDESELYHKSSYKMLNGLEFNSENNHILTEEEFIERSKEQSFNQEKYTRAILHWVGKTEGLMDSKKYAYAIPYRSEKEELKQRVELPEKVITNFERILEKNGNSNLYPLGWTDVKGENINKVMEGDIYYFDYNFHPDDPEGIKQIVTELSLSAIWHKQFAGDTTYGALKQNGYDQYLPFGVSKSRNDLSPAESLLGVVEQMDNESGKNVQDARSLASRVTFHDAICLKDDIKIHTYTRLPVLDSPKTPSPSLYLHDPRSGKPINKNDLSDQSLKPMLNGRKQYLIQPDVKAVKLEGSEGTDSMAIHAEWLPPSDNPVFGTWIDFNNLSAPELDLLLTSLGAENFRPDEVFSHQLGLGKPCGYGQVKLDILSVMLEDKQVRYRNISGKAKVHQLQERKSSSNAVELLDKLSKDVSHPLLSIWQDSEQKLEIKSLGIASQDRLIGNGESLKALRYIRSQESQIENTSIHYPMAENSENIFDWFVNNDDHRNEKQGLGKLNTTKAQLDPLQKNRKVKKR
ncbi:TIGR03986 family CRISPR-associated RAMP protein [Vibrio penaeicida]|uniref:TIGR03986 family type III CRISPR-associated RAMP protein n=1 Tax=Vibrio penaeicida TaxID=104609 RepID=UPI0027367933|nr:TIGR03986 family CRISPR-associated RAMP protein [Vibrio penaeicida]MDP2574209.1 TIGR03986 family CRISPR-associated RAMP protein [Vibrio penaeicida]